MVPSIGEEFLNDLAHSKGSGGGGERGAEADGDMAGPVARPFPEEFAFFEAEDAAPDAVEADGDDGGIDVFHNAFEAAAEGEELAGAGDLAFGKDADELAVFEGVGGDLEGLEHFAGALFGGDGDDAEEASAPMDAGAVVDFLEHEEAHGAFEGGDEEEGIGEGDVVADEESAAAFGDVGAAFDANAVDGFGE